MYQAGCVGSWLQADGSCSWVKVIMRMCNFWIQLIIVFLSDTYIFGDIPQKRPNIVFILWDVQHWSDYGFMCSKDVLNPTLGCLSRGKPNF